MSNYYNLNGIKTELEKRLSYENSILKAWENVTFPTKKRRYTIQNNVKKF